jgi:hypothetical protein
MQNPAGALDMKFSGYLKVQKGWTEGRRTLTLNSRRGKNSNFQSIAWKEEVALSRCNKQ